MSDNNPSGKESNGVECPTCGGEFKSRQGMKIHHSKSHGESIAKTTVECDNCGTGVKRYKYKAQRYDNLYCSDECELEAKTNRPRPEVSKKVTVECNTCGEFQERVPSRVSDSGKVYCSKECYQETISGRQTGENNPNWNPELTEQECEVCGEQFTPDNSNQKGRFCSKKCKGKWQSEVFVGENHPSWKGGSYGYYGPNWPEQRKKALERDNHTCQACGKQTRENERDLDVHHIQKLRKFRKKYDEPEWYQKANKLSNLVTLCHPCHMEWEGVPVKPKLKE